MAIVWCSWKSSTKDAWYFHYCPQTKRWRHKILLFDLTKGLSNGQNIRFILILSLNIGDRVTDFSLSGAFLAHIGSVLFPSDHKCCYILYTTLDRLLKFNSKLCSRNSYEILQQTHSSKFPAGICSVTSCRGYFLNNTVFFS